MKRKFLVLFSLFSMFVFTNNVEALTIEIKEENKDAVVLGDSNTENNTTDLWKYDTTSKTLNLYINNYDENTTEIGIDSIKVSGETSEKLTIVVNENMIIDNTNDTAALESTGPQIIIKTAMDKTLIIDGSTVAPIKVAAGGLEFDGASVVATYYNTSVESPILTSTEATTISFKNNADVSFTNLNGFAVDLEDSSFVVNRAYFTAVTTTDYSDNRGIRIKSEANPFVLTDAVSGQSGYQEGEYYYFGLDAYASVSIDSIDKKISEYVRYDEDFETVIGRAYAVDSEGNKVKYALPGTKLYIKAVAEEGYFAANGSAEGRYYDPNQGSMYLNIDYDDNNSFIMPAYKLTLDYDFVSDVIPQVTGLILDSSTTSIEWDPIDYVDGYEIYRSETAIGGYTLYDTVEWEYTYDDTALANKTYYYQVRAFRYEEDGETKKYGPFSGVKSVVYKLVAPELYLNSYQTTNAYLQMWTNVKVDGYQIFRYNSSTKKWVKISTVKSTDFGFAEYTDKKRTLGSTYKYRIRSYVKVDGKTYYSNYTTDSVKITLGTPYADVTDVTYTTATIKWDKVPKATSYAIYLAEDEGALKKVATTKNLSYTIANLDPKTSYNVRVYAFYGNYKSYDYSYFTTYPTLDFTATDNYNDVTVSWTKPEGAIGYDICYVIGDYTYDNYNCLEYNDDDMVDVNTTSVTIPNVGMGNKVIVWGYAYYQGQYYTESSESLEYVYTTKVRSTNLDVEQVNYKTVNVSWDAQDGIKGYVLYRSTDNKKWTRLTITDQTSYKDTVNTGTRYYYKVRPYVTVGTKNVYADYSNTANIVTKVGTPVANVSKTTYSYNTITWDKVSGASGYVIYRSTDNKKWSTLKTVSNKVVSYKDASLVTNRTYYYKVRAYRTVSGTKKYGSYSEVISGTPYLNNTTVTGYNTYMGYARINFTKVSGATGYVIYRSEEVDGAYTKIGTTKNAYYADKTAEVGKEYFYKVRPYRTISKSNKYGNYSEVASAMRVASDITATVEQTTGRRVNVTMTEVVGAKKYYIYRSTNKSKGYELVKATTELTYEDIVPKYNTTYYYKVRAYGVDYGSYSSVVSVKAVK